MKKVSLCIMFAGCLLASAFSQDSSKPSPEIQFIKGNISDKISAVKRSAESDNSALAVKAIDFVIENEGILKGDRDLSSLAVAGILSYPPSEYLASQESVLKRFQTVFYGLDDKNVKISILDKIASLYEMKTYASVVTFMTIFLESASESKDSDIEIVKKAIDALGRTKNPASFNVLYGVMKKQVWPSLSGQLKNALISVSDRSLTNILGIINTADFVELKLIYSIFGKNEQISQTLRSEIAENLLTRSMILSGNATQVSKDIAEFQLENALILDENKWTRASSLCSRYFSAALDEYEAGFLTEKQFTDVIKIVEDISGREAVKVFSEYMEQMNRETEKGAVPAKPVVLAVIKALGALGDKSAFDCLLYVTYLNYPEEVVASARDALARLKW